MTAFITAMTEVFTAITTWLASITTALLTNEIFMLVFGFTVALLLIGLAVGLVKGIRGRRKKR